MRYNLGDLISPPTMVTGGLLHKMFHVVTEKGDFAIKILNPEIMKRENVLNNMNRSEQISNKFKSQISLIAAKEFNEQYVIELEDYYFMIFDWIDAISLFSTDIKEYHCKEIGKVLGLIHSNNIDIRGLKKEFTTREGYHWDEFLHDAKRQNAEWFKIYKDNIEQIKEWDENIIHCFSKMSDIQVISHRDLDPKNVMWKNNIPFIIDWEAAGFVNPFQEFVEVLNYWTVDSSGEYNKNKFNALVSEYTKYINIQDVDWSAVLHSSFDGMLGWLEYNIRRALGLEGTERGNVKEGIEQLVGTIDELNRYQLHMKCIKEWLSEYAE
jgi:Ser/Thr protein kinase RdoA (MazF antagonist)